MKEDIPMIIMQAVENVEKTSMAGWIEMNTATFRLLESQTYGIPMSDEWLQYHIEQDNSVGFYSGHPIFIAEALENNVVVVTPRLPEANALK